MRGIFMPQEGEERTLRDGFHRLVNARETPAALVEAREWLGRRLAEAPLDSVPQTPKALCSQPWAEVGCAKPNAVSAEILAFHAPLALVEGAWLQSVAQADNGQLPPVAELFAAYLALLGKDEAASPAFAYRAWLKLRGVPLAEASSWRFAQDERIGAPALGFACLQLALGLDAARRFPETLGFTLAYGRSPSPWRLPALARRLTVLSTMNGCAERALHSYLAGGGDWQAVRKGYALYVTAEAAYLAELQSRTEREFSQTERVAGIFRRKLHFARGYHDGITLGGRGLEPWFADQPFDAAGFLAAFAASPYAAGEPGDRPFDRLTGFGGPMFGVFDRQEMEAINAWLDDAASKTAIPSRTSLPATAPFLDPDGRKSALPFSSRRERFGSRDLFHRLINGDLRPQTQDAARRRVGKTLSCARRASSFPTSAHRRFFAYSPQDFARRIAQIHQAEIDRYRPLMPPPRLKREEYVWAIRQFAPAILVDGCWLQYLGEAIHQDKRIHRLLYRIYAEELGEGRVDWNHPKIYRDLLNELSIELPPTHSEEFAGHPGLLDCAFDLPAYLLAISRFPSTHLAEILGLNLAIELSGLGAGYLQLADELRYWNIDPLIVSLHLGIDNLAGGHAAMAAEAVQSYLDEIRELGGEAAVDRSWRRIWSAYLSLGTASRRFRWALMTRYCRRFIPWRIRAPESGRPTSAS
ncbi:MAG: iron-containing redox enzyme family protein [Methylococcaceae bacterium]|nr:iron-containing redox enzyme family protein [Methylococcaceae bacterium]